MKRYLYKISILLTTLVLIGCGGSEGKTETNEAGHSAAEAEEIHLTQEQFQQNGMQLGGLEEKPFPTVIQTTGIIDVPPQYRAVLSATMGGYIRKTPLLIGDTVKKGQALVTIENPDFITLQQEYMEVSQQMTYLRSEYERQQKLVEENITSQKSFLKAESDYKTAQARYHGLRKQLMMLNINPQNVEQGNISSIITLYAPISGSITKMNATKGLYISPAAEILEIINNDHVHLELAVFEKDIMKVKKDQFIGFRIPEASEETFEAKVHLIGTSISANRTIKVHGHLKDESGHNFLTGMFVEAAIVTNSTAAKALPEEAIVAVDGAHFVLLLKETGENAHTFQKVAVTIGETANGFTEIKQTEAFGPGDQFLTKGAFNLVGQEAGGHDH